MIICAKDIFDREVYHLHMVLCSAVQESGQFRADQLFSHQTKRKWPLVHAEESKCITAADELSQYIYLR